MGASSRPPACASFLTRRQSSLHRAALRTTRLVSRICCPPQTLPPCVNCPRAQDASFRLSYGVPAKCPSLVRKLRQHRRIFAREDHQCPISSTSPASATSLPPRLIQAAFPSAKTPRRKPRSASTLSS